MQGLRAPPPRAARRPDPSTHAESRRASLRGAREQEREAKGGTRRARQPRGHKDERVHDTPTQAGMAGARREAHGPVSQARRASAAPLRRRAGGTYQLSNGMRWAVAGGQEGAVVCGVLCVRARCSSRARVALGARHVAECQETGVRYKKGGGESHSPSVWVIAAATVQVVMTQLQRCKQHVSRRCDGSSEEDTALISAPPPPVAAGAGAAHAR